MTNRETLRPLVEGHPSPRSRKKLEGRHSYSISQTNTLSQREEQICKLLVEGLTLRDIAFRLDLSLHTADTHVRNAYLKLRVHTRVELIRRFVSRSANLLRKSPVISDESDLGRLVSSLAMGDLQAAASLAMSTEA
jgi:DNA-binding CsgD family transcriptional regulator